MTGEEVALGAILDGDIEPTGVSHGALLTGFVEAVFYHSTDRLTACREQIICELGGAAFVDICATVASFNAVVIVADATGIPLEDAKAERTVELRAKLSIDDFRK